MVRRRRAARGLVVDRLAGVGQRAWTTAKVPARDPAKGKLKVIEDAPGCFVRMRADGR